MQETQVQSLGWEDPLEKEMATHSSILAWRIRGQRSLASYNPWGHKESDTTEQLTPSLSLSSWITALSWRRDLHSKITVDSDCSHEIRRCLRLGRKAMTNLDSVLKSQVITLLTKVHIVKAMFFLIVMYGCES